MSTKAWPVQIPFAPDSNLVCLALNPHGNTALFTANAFLRKLHDLLRVDPGQPVQNKEYFGSITTLRSGVLGELAMQRIFDALGLDRRSMDAEGEDRLLILRHTLMNPFLIDDSGQINHIEGYFRYLESRIDVLLASVDVA